VAKDAKTSRKIVSPAGKEPRYVRTPPGEKSVAAMGLGKPARSTPKRKPAKERATATRTTDWRGHLVSIPAPASAPARPSPGPRDGVDGGGEGGGVTLVDRWSPPGFRRMVLDATY